MNNIIRKRLQKNVEKDVTNFCFFLFLFFSIALFISISSKLLRFHVQSLLRMEEPTRLR